MCDAGKLFLGLDLSTQQLKAVLLSKDIRAPIYQTAIHFDKDLPGYGTTNGTIQGPGMGEVTSPVSMWLEAIDLLMDKMNTADVNFGAIVAVCGAAQVSDAVADLIACYIIRQATWFRLLVCGCGRIPLFP
jgi:xylulokinase